MPLVRCRTLFFVLAAALHVAGHVNAQPGVALDLDPSPAGDGALLVAAPDARGHGILRARVLLAYANEPLVLQSSSQQAVPIVEQELWSYAGLSLAVAQRWLAYLDVPLLVARSGQTLAELGLEPSDPPAFGDLRLGSRVRIIGPAGKGLQLGVGIELELPTGDEHAYAGDGSLRGRGLVAVGARLPKFVWSIDAGYLRRAARALPGILPTRVGSALTLGASAQFAFDPSARLFLGPEIQAASALGDGASLLDPRSTRVHVLLGARYRPLGGALELAFGFGPDLGQAAGSASYRGLLNIGWLPEAPPPPPDRDADGVSDLNDICLNLPGVPSRDPMMNGCPEVPLDTDGDSVPDGFDACPRVPGEVTAERRTNGCPKPLDRDRDGIPDPEDACAAEPGVSSDDPKQNGCPRPPPSAVLTEEQITISQQIEFETGTSRLKPESDAILRQVLAVLVAHPELERIEVQGHTDDRGTPELNRRLSDERARSVVSWLVSRGIAPTRLVAKGYGQEHPLAENTSEAGRAVNRRVEFRVLKAPSRGAAP